MGSLSKHVSERRYFISNYRKSRYSVDKLIGEPKCIICGHDLVLDIHHVNADKVAVFLCPNHHEIINRIIDSARYHNGSSDCLSVKQIIKRIKEIEKEKVSFYSEISEEHYIETFEGSEPYEYYKERIEQLKKLKKENKERFFLEPNYNIHAPICTTHPPYCEVCKFDLVVEFHHYGKDRPVVTLCPNHHMIVHRVFNDRTGILFNSKEEINNKIKTIERDKIPYYKEISKEEYSEKYKDYQKIRGKTPKVCKSCGKWFYPTKNHREKCAGCTINEIMGKEENFVQFLWGIGNYEGTISKLLGETDYTEEQFNRILKRRQIGENEIIVSDSEHIKFEKFLKNNKNYIKLESHSHDFGGSVSEACNWCGKEIYPYQGVVVPKNGDFKHYKEIFLCRKCLKKWEQKFSETRYLSKK